MQLLLEKKWDKDAHQETMLSVACEVALVLSVTLKPASEFGENIVNDTESFFENLDNSRLSYMETVYDACMDIRCLSSLLSGIPTLVYRKEELANAAASMFKKNFFIISGRDANEAIIESLCEKRWPNKAKKTRK